MAEGLDTFRSTLQQRVRNTLGMRLWENVRGGQLNLLVETRELRTGKDGEHRVQRVLAHQRYASIEGWEILDPRATKLAPGLKRQVDALQILLFDLSNRRDVRDADDFSLRRAARTMAAGRKAIASAIDRIALERRFASPVTVATLRTWSALDNATHKMAFQRRGRDIHIGYDPDHCVRIPVPEEMERTLPVLPHLAEE